MIHCPLLVSTSLVICSPYFFFVVFFVLYENIGVALEQFALSGVGGGENARQPDGVGQKLGRPDRKRPKKKVVLSNVGN